ncbi:helix-turn-helix domain-containing protein [Rhodopirellula bahusiensis]|uniref:helix-turn-helix domain-containing protein n=1 Tax=Rhodopirellula bahusiensis TaxID=2014065 RepID=UPI003D65E4D5
MISVKELANSLGVFRKTIYALCERGDIPCCRIGTGRGTLRFNLSGRYGLRRKGREQIKSDRRSTLCR